MKKLLAAAFACLALVGCSTVDVEYPDGTNVRSLNPSRELIITREGPDGMETITIRKGGEDAGND